MLEETAVSAEIAETFKEADGENSERCISCLVVGLILKQSDISRLVPPGT
jgi:hypothetical protein